VGALRRWSGLLLVALALAAGCATPQPRTATVIGISQFERQDPQKQLVGAAGGVLIGGLIGSQIGSGAGTAVAVTVGALGGGYIGGKIASQGDQQTAYQVTYRYDNGETGTLTLTSKPGVSIGQRVRVYPDALEPL